jgi:hypothetical protein
MSENNEPGKPAGTDGDRALNKIALAILAIFGIFIAIAIPSFIKARNVSQQNACIGNLLIIDCGKEQYAMAMGLKNGDYMSTTNVNKYVKGDTTPICPGGGVYTYGLVGETPRCNISTPTLHILP